MEFIWHTCTYYIVYLHSSGNFNPTVGVFVLYEPYTTWNFHINDNASYTVDLNVLLLSSVIINEFPVYYFKLDW